MKYIYDTRHMMEQIDRKIYLRLIISDKQSSMDISNTPMSQIVKLIYSIFKIGNAYKTGY